MNENYEQRISTLERQLAALNESFRLEIDRRRFNTQMNTRYRKWSKALLLRLFAMVDPNYQATITQIEQITGGRPD